MANYDASIRVLLDAQSAFKAIEKLGQRLDKLKNNATKIQVKTVINEEKAAVQAAEKRLTSQIRLNAALERQANLLKNLTRAGAEGERGNRVKELVEAGKQFKDNLNIQYAVNTALEKELQTQREINRTNSAQNANSSKVLTTFSKRLDLLRAVGATEAEISKVAKTRDKAIERNSRKQTDLAKESFAQLDRQLSTLERKYSAFLNPQKQAASPIRGSKTLVGSPEYLKTVQATVDALERQRVKESAITEELAERTRELNKQVRLRSSIREKIENVRSARAVRERSAFLQGDPQAYERPAGPGGAFRFPQADAIEAAARKQKNFNALQEQARKTAQSNVQLQYNWAKALGQRAEIAKELRDVAAADLNTQKQAAKAEERRLRLARRRKAVLTAREKAQRTRRAVGEGIIGGAFPLLFGQGIGASVGGGLGGVAGGLIGGQFGFGLSLLGTAIGGAIDSFAELGKEIASFDNAASALSDRGVLSTAVEKQVKALQGMGLSVEANRVALQEFSRTFGADKASDLKRLGSESEKFNKAVIELTTSLGLLLAGPLAEFIKEIRKFIDKDVLRATGASVRSGLDEKTQKAFDLEVKTAIEKAVFEQFGKKGESTRKGEAAINYLSIRDPQALQAILDKYRLKVKVDIELTEEQRLKKRIEELKVAADVASSKSAVSDIISMFENLDTDRAKKQEQYNRTAENYEKELASIRETVEQKISSLRINTIKEENRLLDQQADNRAKAAELEASTRLQALKAELSASGLDPKITSQALSIEQAFADFDKKALSIEEQKAKIKRDAALEILSLEIQHEEFKYSIAKQTNELNLRTQKEIQRVNTEIQKQNSEASKRKYDLEVLSSRIKLAELESSIKLLRAELKIYDQSNPIIGVINKELNDTLDLIEKAYKVLQNAKPPKPFTEVARPLSGVSQAGVDKAFETFTRQKQRVDEARLQGLDYDLAAARQKLQASLQGEQLKITESVNNLIRQQNSETEKQIRIRELVNAGYTEQQAAAVQALEVERKLSQDLLNDNQERLEAYRLANLENKELQDVINEALSRVPGIQDEINAKYEQLITNAKRLNGPINEYIQELEASLANTEAMVVSLGQSIEQSLSTAISSAVQNLVTGAQTIEQTLSSMFENIGKAFIDMAAQIIAKQLVLITLQSILKALGGAPGGGVSSEGAFDIGAAAGGGGGGANIFADIAARGGLRANGGPVAPNTTYLVGERGPELLTMGSQGGYVHSNQSSAMERYRNGGPAGTQTVNVSYSVTEINGMRFVTEDQFRAGMDQAAKRGANMGQARTLGTLKNSRSQRSRLGL